MNEAKPISQDGEGFEILKEAILDLLNRYPALDGRIIAYGTLEEDTGISMEPESGALIFSEKTNIVGDVTRRCQFPFFVVYRSGATSEYLKMSVNEFLDTLGAWLSKEPVKIKETVYQLKEYPTLTGNRKITKVTRFNSYALEPNQNNTQDWVLPVTIEYTHEIQSW